MDRIVYLLNNWDQGSETSAVWNFYAGCHFVENPMVALQNVCCFFRLPKRQGFCFSGLVLWLTLQYFKIMVIPAGGEDNLVF